MKRSLSADREIVLLPQLNSYRLFGHVQHLGPSEFYAFASAVQDEGGEGTIVLTAKATSLQAAQAGMERLLIEVGAKVREAGGEVIDVLA